VSAVSTTGARRGEDVTVPSDGRVSVTPSTLVPGSWAAVSIILAGGGVAATETISGPLGATTAPCASQTSRSWDFAYGSTAGADALTLALFNPTVTPASVDVSAITAGGVEQPPAYQEIQVPPDGVVTEALDNHVQQDSAFGTEVEALSGSVVAAQLQTTSSHSTRAVSLQLGSPRPTSEWVVPQSTQPSGGNVVFHVLNPAPRSTLVHVSVRDHLGSSPLSLSVGPRSIAALAIASDAHIPRGMPFSMILRSSGGVGIVVARQVVAPASAREPQRGVTSAVPGGWTSWIVPTALPSGTRATQVAVVPVGSHATRVTVTEAADGETVPIPGGTVSEVEPGAALVVGLAADAGAGIAIGVDADGPVAVEVDTGPAAGPGIIVLPPLTRD
jgi:hypothetical protein